MYRSDRHSRDGLFPMAISAVDNTLWDLRGRYYQAPVYRLLGGPTRESVEFYGSCLGYSLERDKVLPVGSKKPPIPRRSRALRPCAEPHRFPWLQANTSMRWEVERYLQAGAVSVVQANPEWCGGTSELVRICGVASLHDAHVITHGHSIHAVLHVNATQSPMTCPLGEHLILKMESYYHFEKRAPVPVNLSMRGSRFRKRPDMGKHSINPSLA